MKFLLLIILSFYNLVYPLSEHEFLICALSLKAKKEPAQSLYFATNYQEGLCTETLIKTPQGYTPIEDLNEQDLIVGYDEEGNYYEQPILAISKRQITNYSKLQIGNQILYAAPDQKFYVAEKQQWVKAVALIPSNIILQAHNTYELVEQTEKINANATVYFLKLTNPCFYTTENDICVHNTDALTIGTQMLSIGAIVLNNPILATIGSAIELAELGMQIYKMINRINTLAQEQVNTQCNKNLPEQIYYETRKNDLLKIRQEFLAIRQGLYRIVAAQQNALMQCTETFLHQIEDNTCNTLISIIPTQELQLNEVQRQELTAFRQQELDQLEQEIMDLQVTLAAHFNELVIRKNQAYEAVNVLFAESQKLIAPWNKYLGNVTPQAAIEYYERELKIEYLLQNLDLKNKELKLAIGYYKNTNNASIFKNTTNIVTVIAQEEDQVRKTDNYIQESRKTNTAWKKITEEYFAKRKINANNIQFNVQNNIKSLYATQKYLADQEAVERLALLKQNNNHKKPKQEKKSSQVSTADGGKPPDDKDPRNKNNKPPKKDERKVNKTTKTEFFKKVRDRYEHWKDEIYKKKSHAESIEGAEYLEWDSQHYDVEAYGKNEKHIGSINPETEKIYKPAVPNRKLSK